MIVRPPANWLRMLFIWDGSVLKSIVPQLLVMLVISSLAVLTHGRVFGAKVPLDTAPFPLVGVSLAIFLGFRNNAAYARFVEARQIWGHILNAARTLTSQVIHYLPAGESEESDTRLLCMRQLVAFVYALTHQLRGTDPAADLARYLDQDELAHLRGLDYIPMALLDRLRRMLAEATAGRRDQALWMFDAQLAELATAVGGCERIVHTPIPYPYGVLIHRTVYIFCFLLPFGLVDAIGIATPLISVFVAYTLFAIEAIAQEVSDPFGTQPNCLALYGMTRNIERAVMELCGEIKPDALRPCARFHIH